MVIWDSLDLTKNENTEFLSFPIKLQIMSTEWNIFV